MCVFFFIVMIIVVLVLFILGVMRLVLILEGKIDKLKFVKIGIEMIVDEGDCNMCSVLMMVLSMLGFDKFEGEIDVYKKMCSIWGIVNEFVNNKNYFVVVLVVVFLIVIFILKFLM